MPGQKYSRINIRIFLVLSLLQGPQTHVAPVPVALQTRRQVHLQIGDLRGASKPQRRRKGKKTLGGREGRQGNKSVQGAEFL